MRGLAPLLAALLAACSNAAAGGGEDSYARGAAALAAGQPRLARIELLNAIEADPDNADARLLQARTYLELGDGVAAEAELEMARKLGAAKGATHHLMAHAYALQGEADAALKEAAQAPKKHSAHAARARGLALAAQGDVGGASAAFAEATAGAPDDAPLWADVARFRRSAGDVAGAIAAIDRAVKLRPGDAGALLLRGELTRSQYGLKAALPWFDRALELDPNNVNALLERAATLGEMGRMSEMLKTTRSVLAISPGHPNAYYLQAVLAARARRYDLARALLERSGDALGDLPAAMLLRGALAYAAGDHDRAIEQLRQLLAVQPDNRKARRLLAAAQWRSGDFEGTVATLRPIAGNGDADSYSLALIGRALSEAGADEAAGFLARAHAAGESPARAFAAGQGLGELRRRVTEEGGVPAEIALVRGLIDEGGATEALARARRIQAAFPGAPDAHLLVGDSLALQRQFAAAAEEYRKAANLAFTEPTALRLIDALERSGNSSAAAQVLSLFLEQNPRNISAQLLAARQLMAAGRWQEASRIYETLRRRLGDRDAALLNNLAWAYFRQGDKAAAVALARKAWALDRANPATADTLGWMLFRSGRRLEGLALLQQAASGAPADAAIRRKLRLATAG